MVKSDWILAVMKVETKGFSGVRKREEFSVFPKCLVHTSGRMELPYIITLRKNGFGADRFTLRCLLELPSGSRKRSSSVLGVRRPTGRQIWKSHHSDISFNAKGTG